MKPSTWLLTVAVLLLDCVIAWGQAIQPVESLQIEAGALSVVFRDNSQSPAVLSGIDALFHREHAPHFDAFDPQGAGASAGLNFEHIISGHPSPHNKFTPRHGPFRLHPLPAGNAVKLVRKASDSPWLVESELTYTVSAPHSIDFEFRCTPREAAKFGQRGHAIFFFANYMNDVADVALHFRGHPAANVPEQWIAATAPQGHPDWRRGGNYRSVAAEELILDDDVQFRLNSWSYEWPRIAQPFYYGKAAHGMTLILMFDRLHTPRDQIRFSLYKFKLPARPRPAWDFQYVVPQVKSNQQYGFSGRLIWKPFVSPEDCQKEYQQWKERLKADRVEQLRQLGATVFTRRDAVVEVNANRSKVTDQQMDWIGAFREMTDLSLEDTRVSDAGIAQLAQLQKLEWLNLYRCAISDEALHTIRKLRRLQHLPIGHSRVTDAGLQQLSDMKQLEYLGLRGNPVSDRGLASLVKLTNLTGLHLGETQVSDGGLTHLQHFKKLRQLWLDETSISDAAVPHLAKLRTLVELHLRGTRLTQAGVEQLQRALPRCEIEPRQSSK